VRRLIDMHFPSHGDGFTIDPALASGEREAGE
jgi:hypothetical protein